MWKRYIDGLTGLLEAPRGVIIKVSCVYLGGGCGKGIDFTVGWIGREERRGWDGKESVGGLDVHVTVGMGKGREGRRGWDGKRGRLTDSMVGWMGREEGQGWKGKRGEMRVADLRHHPRHDGDGKRREKRRGSVTHRWKERKESKELITCP